MAVSQEQCSDSLFPRGPRFPSLWYLKISRPGLPSYTCSLFSWTLPSSRWSGRPWRRLAGRRALVPLVVTAAAGGRDSHGLRRQHLDRHAGRAQLLPALAGPLPCSRPCSRPDLGDKSTSRTMGISNWSRPIFGHREGQVCPESRRPSATWWGMGQELIGHSLSHNNVRHVYFQHFILPLTRRMGSGTPPEQPSSHPWALIQAQTKIRDRGAG